MKYRIFLKRLILSAFALVSLTGLAAAEELLLREYTPMEPVYFEGQDIDLDVSAWAVSDSQVSLLELSPYEQMKHSIVEQIKQKKSTIEISNLTEEYLTTDQVFQLYYNTLYDFPEETYFARTALKLYRDESYRYRPGETIQLSPKYLSLDDDAYQKAVSDAVEDCFADGMTDLEKVVAAHDWIVLNCQYDPFVANRGTYTTVGGVTYRSDDRVYTSYGVFVEGNAVCQGYALAFQVLMNRVGIPCCFVSGDGHAWNAVQLDGEWYYLDTTWDDPIHTGGVGDFMGRVVRDHFLKGEITFSTNHANCSPWSTEYHYTISRNDYELPEGLQDAADMAVYRKGDSYYLISGGYLQSYGVGSGFESGTAIVNSPLEHMVAFRAAVIDRESQMLYYSCDYSDVSFVYAVDMERGTAECIYQNWSKPKSRGLKIVDAGAGVRELWTWYDYTKDEKLLTFNCSVAVEAGGYSYYAAEDTVWINLDESVVRTVMVIWYDAGGEFLKADFCTGNQSYAAPAGAETLKILAVGDTEGWIPLCAAVKPDL